MPASGQKNFSCRKISGFYGKKNTGVGKSGIPGYAVMNTFSAGRHITRSFHTTPNPGLKN